EVRGAYTAVPEPDTGRLWVPHLLLATDTPQPALDFQSTVFPTITVLTANSSSVADRLLFRSGTSLMAPGAFIDSVSGPRDVAFPAGGIALVAMEDSEDVLVFDTAARVEIGLVRPLPSAMLEGIIADATGTLAYVHGRASHDVTVLQIDRNTHAVTVAGTPIE